MATEILINGIPHYRYEDGTTLPIIAGGQTDIDYNAIPTGTEEAPYTGPIYDPDTGAFLGELMFVPKEPTAVAALRNSTGVNVTPGGVLLKLPDGSFSEWKGGVVTNALREGMQLDPRGKVQGERALSLDLPSGGNGGSGGVSYSISQYIPNAVDKLNAFVSAMEAAAAAGALDQNNAIQQFNAFVTQTQNEMNAQIQNAQTAGAQATLQQNADRQAIDIATEQQRDLTTRQTSQVNRDINVADIRQRAASDFTGNVLPYALPAGMESVFGFPTTQFNPDVVYNTQGLNAIRDIPDTSGINFPTPSVVPTLPTVTAPPASAYPTIPPAFNPLQNFDWTPLIQAALANAS